MIQTALQRDRTARWTFTLSLTLHLLIILVFSSNDFFRSRLPEATPYYVDIVSLPTADPAPAGGSPTAPAAPPAAPPQPAPPAHTSAPAQKPAMTLPLKKALATPSKTAPPTDQNQKEQETREFNEKMNRLARNAEARHQAEAIAALQKKLADRKGSGAAAASGSSTASGSAAGSDYGAYIQSRLQDALSTTITFQSQNPESAVLITIDRSGKLIKYVMVRPSPDKLFNNAVIRAIEKAKVNFPPVPSGKGFEKLYVFSPQEVQK